MMKTMIVELENNGFAKSRFEVGDMEFIQVLYPFVAGPTDVITNEMFVDPETGEEKIICYDSRD